MVFYHLLEHTNCRDVSGVFLSNFFKHHDVLKKAENFYTFKNCNFYFFRANVLTLKHKRNCRVTPGTQFVVFSVKLWLADCLNLSPCLVEFVIYFTYLPHVHVQQPCVQSTD